MIKLYLLTHKGVSDAMYVANYPESIKHCAWTLRKKGIVVTEAGEMVTF